MATVTKDFRVKAGLVVEGSTATVDGHDVLTEGLVDAKGDLLVASGADAVTRVALGTNGYILTADDSEAAGVKWAAAPAVGTFETSVTFEGATADSYETTLTVTDPTADRTITLPDATGTVALTSDITSAVDALDTDDIEEGSTNLYFTNQRAIDAVGGSATSDNTPDTVVKRDINGDFAAGTVTVNRVNIGSVGYIEDDGSIEIVNNDGDDVNITADDIRLNATDDVILSAGYNGSVAGDISLNTSGGVILLNSADVYVGSGEIDSERVATKGYVDTEIANIDLTFNSDEITEGTTNLYYTDARVDSHLSGGDGISYLTGTISADVANGLEITDGHIVIDRDTVDTWYDANGAAATAQSNAEDYADGLINDASNASDEVWSAYKTSTEIGLAQTAAETYADNAVASLVDGAPALLDTLNELAAAINDDASFASTIGTSIGEKVAKSGDTMTGALTLHADPTSNLQAATKQYVDSAQTAAEDYADGLATNYEASGAVSTHSGLTTGVHGVTGNVVGTTDTQSLSNKTISYVDNTLTVQVANVSDLNASATELNYVEGVTSSIQDQLDDKAPLVSPSFTTPDLGEATATSIALTDALVGTAIATAGTSATTIDTWSATTYSSAKYLVQMKKGTDIEVIEVLVTVDGSNNVYLTEYADVISNEVLGTTNAVYSSGNVLLQVTGASADTSVKVQKVYIEA